MNSDRAAGRVGQADLRPDALGRVLQRQQRAGPPGARRRPHPRRLLPLRARPARRRLPGHPHRRRPASGSRRTTTTRRCRRPGSRATSASSPGRSRQRSTTRPGAPSRRRCDWSWHEMQPVGVTRTLLRPRRLRGRLHLPRHAHRARLGRLDVRGAHARRLRRRGGLGAQLAGVATTRSTSAPSASTASSRRATATGASARRATRQAATASTASTPSASTPTATSPTRR